jgi:uncharacterized protein (UPF0335 family)
MAASCGRHIENLKPKIFMSERAKQVVDFRASKGITTAQSDEHQRNWSEKGWKWAVEHGNYDRSREHLNFEIARGGKVQPIDRSKSIPQRMAELLAERGIKDPNVGLAEPRFRTVVNFIFGGSRERMHELAFGSQKVDLSHGADNSNIHRMPEIERWATDIYNHVCEQWGEQNIAGFYVHLDEKNPHIHCTLLPINAQNKFAFKELFAGADKYEFKRRTTAMHDSFAKVNEKWGLYRGDNIAQTLAKHSNPEEYHRQLSRECSTMEEEIERNRTVLQLLYADIRMAERRVKGLTTMVEKLEASKADLNTEIEKLQEELKAGEGDAAAIQSMIDMRKAELVSVERKCTDKMEKLSAAEQLLESLNAEMDAIKQRTEHLRDEGYKAADNIHQQIELQLSNALLHEVLCDFRMRLPSLSMYDRSMFEDSMLMDLAEKGDAVMNCAVLLFAGYIDQATQFAQGHGGGGGTTSGWGRDPDEDERAWALKCMRQACRMMRPSATRASRRR